MLWLQFRKTVHRKYGGVKGHLQEAIHEALQLWINAQMQETMVDKPQNQTSKTLKPETHKPEIQKPETQKTEVQKPETHKPQIHKPEIHKPEVQVKPEPQAKPQTPIPEKLRVNLVESVKITLLPWLDQLEVKESPAEIQVYRKGSLTPEEWNKINNSLKQLNAKWDPLKQAWIIPKTTQT